MQWLSGRFGVDKSGPSAEASQGSTERVVSVLNSTLHLCKYNVHSLLFRLRLLAQPQKPPIARVPGGCALNVSLWLTICMGSCILREQIGRAHV